MKETAEERKEKGRRGFKSMRTKDSERIERKRERERESLLSLVRPPAHISKL